MNRHIIIWAAIGTARALGWLMAGTLFLALLFVLTLVLSGRARAEDPVAEDPVAAAREIGRAGQAAAGAIAKDASRAAAVPGYAGAALPERSLGAEGLEDAAHGVLADPADPGGKAGRALIEGAVSRPERPVALGDAAVRQSEAVMENPNASEWDAHGIGSGSVRRCDAGLEAADATNIGACGGVNWCVGAGCETVETPANTGFAAAVTRLNMALEMAGEEFDRDNLQIFSGERRACSIRWFGWQNCCTDSGFLLDSGLADCNEDERLLAEQHQAGTTRYLGEYCAKKTLFGVCRRRDRAWCVFGSKLGTDPARGGATATRHGLGRLPRLHGCRDRGHRLRARRSFRVHREPDRRGERALGVAARRGRDRCGHARAY